MGAVLGALLLWADAARAQEPEADSASAQADSTAPVPSTEPPTESSREPLLFWTLTSDADRIILGQWTWHLSEHRTGVQNDRIIGGVYHGYFVGTFRTTHGPRAYAVGVERHWIRLGSGPVRGALGYRFGLVYGYDERLGWMSEALPILPFAQPLAYAQAGPLGAEVTHTWVVVSVTLSLPIG